MNATRARRSVRFAAGPGPRRLTTAGRAAVAALFAALVPALFLVVLAASTVRAQDRVLVLTTDFTTGSLAVMPVASPWSAQNDLAPACGDAVVRVAGGLAYVVNRTGCDNVEVINPSGWSLSGEFSVGAGTNPQDIAVITPSRAYVTRYETNDLLEVNPQSGAQLGTISLAAFADADGLCEMHRMLVRGSRLFVQVQRLNRQGFPWTPVPPSLLVVIDLDTRTIVDADPNLPGVQGIALQGTNPIAPMQVDLQTREILVPEAGTYGVADAGGIERVDPVALLSRGFLVTEAALGGDLVDFAQWSPTLAYAVVSQAGFNTVLLRYNPATGANAGIVYNPGGYVLGDLLVYPAGKLFVSDRTYTNPGVRVYDAANGAALAGPIGTGLPPNDLVLLPGATSGADTEVSLGAPYPNPSAGTVRLAVLGRGADARRLEVFDATGRLIRAVALPSDGEDPAWDGRDERGRPAPAGAYQLRVLTATGRSAGRSVRILR